MCPKGQTDSGQEYGRPRQTHHCEGTRRAADMGLWYVYQSMAWQPPGMDSLPAIGLLSLPQDTGLQ